MTLDPRRTAVGAGCSYIKAKDPAFVAQLERWERAGLVAEWRTAHPHTVTAPGEWAPLPTSGEAGKASAWPAWAGLSPLLHVPGAGTVGAGTVGVVLGCPPRSRAQVA